MVIWRRMRYRKECGVLMKERWGDGLKVRMCMKNRVDGCCDKFVKRMCGDEGRGRGGIKV